MTQAEPLASFLIVFYALLGGAIRVSTPFLFVALGECLTEKSGRINLGLEGNLILGAMTGYAVSFNTGSAWIGVLAAGGVGVVLGVAHGWICKLPKVNDIAVGLAFMGLGTGLAFFFGKPYIQPTAPRLTSVPLGDWSDSPQVQQALQVNPLFFIGIVLAVFLWWMLRNTRWGLIIRVTGDSAASARAMGVNVNGVRILTTAAGGALAGIGGAFLSLSYPGSWNEGLSSGQGLMAVALVIFARWNPLRCVLAALLFGAAGALGPSLQSIGVSSGYHFFNAAPYILTLVIMIASARSRSAAIEAPRELSIIK
ncbi:ABC transporter permease [Roseinatronobacter sp. S2]|uniref:ABC transporter permease n=1 Tax=Roseinatronobacter sp. S2 TaxID=3035471 RepID=UPI0024102A42|nr:ABC transporter permease [Roseinatronobacter sp. S2]WFE76970.1 ABC transporter permease [Roseinatronobacter sp. S2]